MKPKKKNMINQDDIHLLNTLQKLESAGYTDQFDYRDGFLINLTNKSKYERGRIRKITEYRFEGMTDPGDMSILFAIELDDDRKGTLAAVYGPMADADLFHFMNELNPEAQ